MLPSAEPVAANAESKRKRRGAAYTYPPTIASSGMPRKAASTKANPATPQIPKGLRTARIQWVHLANRCFKSAPGKSLFYGSAWARVSEEVFTTEENEEQLGNWHLATRSNWQLGAQCKRETAPLNEAVHHPKHRWLRSLTPA